MSTNFDKLLIVLKRWPILEQRLGRDYGAYLREFVKTKHSGVPIFFADPNKDTKAVESLFRITENLYGNKYGYAHKVGASGLETKDLETILSDQFIDEYSKKKFKF